MIRYRIYKGVAENGGVPYFGGPYNLCHSWVVFYGYFKPIRNTNLNVLSYPNHELVIRILLFRVLYWDPPIFGNSHKVNYYRRWRRE